MLELLTGLLITVLITVTNCEEVGGLKGPVINTGFSAAYHTACARPRCSDLGTTALRAEGAASVIDPIRLAK